MKFMPILLSGAMVRALLDGGETRTAMTNLGLHLRLKSDIGWLNIKIILNCIAGLDKGTVIGKARNRNASYVAARRAFGMG